MPLPSSEGHPLPTRRSLRDAERAAAAARVVVPPVAVPDHVLEGADDTWLPGVTPRPAPLAPRGRAADLSVPRRSGSAWRRLPQVLVLGLLAAAAAGYVAVDGSVATAGEVASYDRAGRTVSPEPAAVVPPAVAAPGPGLVAGPDGLLRPPVDEASRGGGRAVLPGCDGVPPETPQENGRMDQAYLCTLWDGTTRVRADAAVSLTLLNERYRAALGTDICLTDGYRSYEAQVSVRARKPGLAAEPGTSEHGFGLAVDLCGGVESQGEGYRWLRENAGALGFENPRWAQEGGGGPFEPWHWEYVAGQR